ncbi:MAG: hypothetical protein SGPRY_005299 [Prymnesium sp.]
MNGAGRHVSTPPASRAALRLVEHSMPLMPPSRYEHALKQWADESGEGRIVRWYVSGVEEEEERVTAEVVLAD